MGPFCLPNAPSHIREKYDRKKIALRVDHPKVFSSFGPILEPNIEEKSMKCRCQKTSRFCFFQKFYCFFNGFGSVLGHPWILENEHIV